MHFKGSAFHRVVSGFGCQGGCLNEVKDRGQSIYGETFADESFSGKAGKHTGLGCLTMANAGPHTNGSQFFICTGQCKHMDGKHVVFGRVVSGYEVVRKIDAVGSRQPPFEPSKSVVIADCGVATTPATGNTPETTRVHTPESPPTATPSAIHMRKNRQEEAVAFE